MNKMKWIIKSIWR